MAITKNELKTLLTSALTGTPSANFSAEDTNEAAIKALLEYTGIDATDYRQIKRNPAVFSVVEEVIDELLPKQLENVLGGFAVVKQYARNEEVVYKTKGLGKRRALLSIVPGARAGIYKARRLDGKVMSITTSVRTAGVFVQLEEVLLGTASLSELMANILEGFELNVYKDIVSALRTVKVQAPAANRASAEGLDKPALDKLIKIVNAYGTANIICFESFASQINNMVNFANATPNIPVEDINEIRSKGFVGTYYGTPVIVIPNYIVDEVTNEQWLFSEADAFVLPAESKPVVVALQGEGYIQENDHALGGAEMNYHKMMGTAILAYNNLAIYTDTAIQKDEGTGLI